MNPMCEQGKTVKLTSLVGKEVKQINTCRSANGQIVRLVFTDGMELALDSPKPPHDDDKPALPELKKLLADVPERFEKIEKDRMTQFWNRVRKESLSYLKAAKTEVVEQYARHIQACKWLGSSPDIDPLADWHVDFQQLVDEVGQVSVQLDAIEAAEGDTNKLEQASIALSDLKLKLIEMRTQVRPSKQLPHGSNIPASMAAVI